MPLGFRKAFLPFQAVLIQCTDENRNAIPNAFGSGFLLREDGTTYLYTCWHVVTGVQRYPLRIGHKPPNRRYIRVVLQGVSKPSEGVESIGGKQVTDLGLYDSSVAPPRPIWLQDSESVENGDLNALGIRVPFWHDAVKIRIGNEMLISDIQIPERPDGRHPSPEIGDKVYVVGFPYSYSALGPDQPTAIVLTRHVAASRVSGRLTEILLDGAGAPGMSGGPVFIERDDSLYLLGPYTGLIYPDHQIEKNEKVTALGTACDLSLLWKTTAMAMS